MPNKPRPDNPARPVRIDDALWARVKWIASRQGVKPSEIVRRAIRAYVGRAALAEFRDPRQEERPMSQDPRHPRVRYDKPPWPYYTAANAAKLLGVDLELINGIARDKKIRAVEVQGKSGAPVYLVSCEDIDALVEKLA